MLLFLRFFLSFSFDWENVPNVEDSLWPQFQTLRSSLKIIHGVPRISTSFRCLEMFGILNKIISLHSSNLRPYGKNKLQYKTKLKDVINY